MEELILNDGVRNGTDRGDRIVKFISDGTYDKSVVEENVQEFIVFLDSSVSFGFVGGLAKALFDKVGISEHSKYMEIVKERDDLRAEVKALKDVYACFRRNFETSCY